MKNSKIFKEIKSRGFYRAGFTLLELLMVVAIIGILIAVVLVSLSSARDKGADAGVESNLRNATAQAEIFYGTNTASPNSYTGVCTNGAVGGAIGIGSQVLIAAKAVGLSSYTINGTGTLSTATCNDSADTWAAEVPLSTPGQMWCVDNAGRSKAESASIGTGTACN